MIRDEENIFLLVSCVFEEFVFLETFGRNIAKPSSTLASIEHQLVELGIYVYVLFFQSWSHTCWEIFCEYNVSVLVVVHNKSGVLIKTDWFSFLSESIFAKILSFSNDACSIYERHTIINRIIPH